jgi:hypothetical protein
MPTRLFPINWRGTKAIRRTSHLNSLKHLKRDLMMAGDSVCQQSSSTKLPSNPQTKGTTDMAYFAENTEPMLALEAMVDKVGLANVLYALEHICRAKADHIRENWQDDATAKTWDFDANKCKGAAARLRAG